MIAEIGEKNSDRGGDNSLLTIGCLLLTIYQGFGRDAGDGGMGGYIVEDDGAGADGSPLAYLDAGYYCGSGSDPGPSTDVDVAAECGMGRDMDVVAYFAFMINGRSGVHYAVLPDYCITLDNRALHYDRTFTDCSVFRNNSGRMNRGSIHQQKSVRYHFPNFVRADTDDQGAFNIFIRSFMYWYPMNILAMRGVIIEASDTITLGLYYILYHL